MAKRLQWIICLAGVLGIATAPAARSAEEKEDPAATKLFEEAVAARATWQGFPGFSAAIEVNVDGKVSQGRVDVSGDGKVDVKIDDPAASKWAKGALRSIVSHRLAGEPGKAPAFRFVDSDTTHPLGRAIQPIQDEFHSSYRILDKQITVVNRQMKDVRFTIVVLKNRVVEDNKFLPASFTVTTWDLKTGVLRSSEATHQSWHRIGKFDLPVLTTVVAAESEKLDARTLKLSKFKLHETTAAR